MSAGAFDDPGRDRPAFPERGRVVEVGGFAGQVVGGVVGGFAACGIKAALVAVRRIVPATFLACPSSTLVAWRCTHSAVLRSQSGNRQLAAFQRYSRTWTKSTTIVTFTSRALASDLIRWIWWLLPSTSATQVRRRLGSRRSASPKTCLMTVPASLTMLAHQPLVGGDRPRRGLMAVVAGEDVGRRAGRRGRVIDRADLRHPLAAELL